MRLQVPTIGLLLTSLPICASECPTPSHEALSTQLNAYISSARVDEQRLHRYFSSSYRDYWLENLFRERSEEDALLALTQYKLLLNFGTTIISSIETVSVIEALSCKGTLSVRYTPMLPKTNGRDVRELHLDYVWEETNWAIDQIDFY
ncbi:hypothetical protein KUV89_17535 [Marinobacter hydrocarbonoclasticus]|nr:hypothetical protein [Marinobacter nauticus]